MAEVLVEFDAVLPGPGGTSYVPRACARVGDGGLWEGWLEFTEVRIGRVVRTGRETTQPTRQDTMYWATGLSRIYLEGALERALDPVRVAAPPTVDVAPAFDRPAPAVIVVPAVARPVLDPFEVYVQGEDVLRQELLALDVDHLRSIIRGFGLGGGVGATSSSPTVLAEYIVAEVSARVEAQRPTWVRPAESRGTEDTL